MRKQTALLDLSFDLKVDLTRWFHWNVKEVFLYVVLSFDTDRAGQNDIVVYDKIVFNGRDRYSVDLANVRNKYAVNDLGDIR